MNRFQTDPSVRLFCGNILAAGEGIELSAASDVALLELPWNSSTLDQGIARILKPGVTTRMGIHYLLASGTIDEDIAAIVDQKRSVAAAIHDGRITKSDDTDMVYQLLRLTKQRRLTA
jgi:SWI/SNF-related matrix-associated actin-dependent regulator 1 of chromatin subfamily A